MKSFGCVDWITCTYPESSARDGLLPSNCDLGEFIETGHGSEGYKQSWRIDSGALIRGGGNANMGLNLMLPGDALALIRAQGVSERELCRFIRARGGKPSRFDVAIDIFAPDTISIAWFEAHFRAGTLTTPARTMGIRGDLGRAGETGEGRYLGSRQSERYLRLYDKGLEQKTDERGRWLRLELETHKNQAIVTMDAIAGHESTRTVINRAISRYADIDDQEYRAVLADQSDALADVPRKAHSTIRWVGEQVVPALVTFQLTHPSVDILTVLKTLYDDEFARRSPPKIC